PAYLAEDALVLETFDDLAPYARNSNAGREVRVLEPGEAGSVLAGVTQRVELCNDDARAGSRYAVYTATSSLASAGGWSVIQKRFDPPLDLSWHKGIGFWLRGDGRGGAFKLQLRDGSGATDYYVQNDFSGWRYQQLARPANDPIDYSKVSHLAFYYNSLPAETAVACGIDDVKALRRLDTRAIVDPYVEVAGRRIGWQGSLTEGQYLVFWPEESATRYGLPLQQPEVAPEKPSSVILPPGAHSATFGCRGGLSLPVRVRVTLQVPERYEVALMPSAAFQSVAATEPTEPKVERRVVVYGEKGKFAGWPANHGMWIWGNEILVGFSIGMHKDLGEEYHNIDREKPEQHVLARSLDGGEIWKMEYPADKGMLINKGGMRHGSTDPKQTEPEPVAITEPIDFSHSSITRSRMSAKGILPP
ncbi:MAG: hypothetical protein ACC645_26520, partial [Pirellulales bacterium]